MNVWIDVGEMLLLKAYFPAEAERFSGCRFSKAPNMPCPLLQHGGRVCVCGGMYLEEEQMNHLPVLCIEVPAY